MSIFRRLFVLPLIALIAACGGTTYQVPADEAQTKLSKAPPPLEMVDGLHDRINVSKTADGGVRWVLVNANGSAIAQIVATIEPSGGAAAEVTLDDEPLEGVSEVSDPKLIELFELAIHEHVDATMTNRHFDIAALGTEMMGVFVNKSFQHTSKELQDSTNASDAFESDSDNFGTTDNSDNDEAANVDTGFPPGTAGIPHDSNATTVDMGDEAWGANAQH
jgi:hypothetical protein